MAGDKQSLSARWQWPERLQDMLQDIPDFLEHDSFPELVTCLASGVKHSPERMRFASWEHRQRPERGLPPGGGPAFRNAV
jgi:hypothetical protein